jgi:hypothetical protein
MRPQSYLAVCAHLDESWPPASDDAGRLPTMIPRDDTLGGGDADARSQAYLNTLFAYQPRFGDPDVGWAWSPGEAGPSGGGGSTGGASAGGGSPRAGGGSSGGGGGGGAIRIGADAALSFPVRFAVRTLAGQQFGFTMCRRRATLGDVKRAIFDIEALAVESQQLLFENRALTRIDPDMTLAAAGIRPDCTLHLVIRLRGGAGGGGGTASGVTSASGRRS